VEEEMNTRKFGLIAVTTILAIAGCGGSGNSGQAAVDSIVLEQSIISVGGSTVVDTDFSFDAGNVFDNDGEVVLHFLLPPGVTFRNGSGEIDTVGGNDFSASALVTSCSGSGETLVTFNIDEDKLLGALNPSGDADASLTFLVDGTAATQGNIQDRGDESVDSAICGQTFSPDATAAITVQ
jgi:hypothetical protein